ncbi:ATP-dependent DNA helicase pif1-like [Juglans microcarpa x Juglans regia]|uniref:ATP-dependent DNA helicase pif1-like n=1 Tax=Juglans microcarpa x Juglans regia TaxID=2249226 RepID=UPI001B7EAA3E|nr:ATP-dependent DNA helicase pif1-like [Juglans microcarpa x Juglans regia]
MTCNPSWKEILDELGPQEEAQNRPDLIARIFRAKLEELKDELFKRKIFGKVSAYVYVIEHQKRGLPHAHFLIILQRDWKIYAPESFDEIVSAEIPDKERNLHLHKANETESREINDEFAVLIPEEDLMASMSLNPEQQHAYESILQKVLLNESAAFFIDGPGGTGKTFLYKALLVTVRSRNLIALATASSGVAASILPGGRTSPSRFKIPLDLDKNSTCCVSKQGALAKLLRLAKLIIWDEAPMSRKECMQSLDKMLRDITDSRLPFGGKIIVFGGDFRQVLPVGNGTTPITIENKIKISSEMLIPYKNDVESLDDLIDAVFQDIGSYSENLSEMTNRAILTPKNNSVDEINTILIQRFPGTVTQYYSFDETIDTSEQGIMEDFLNTLIPNGLPPHELLLKKNCPIMLLRNVNPSEGLCNGTRLICRNFERNIIDAEIAVGHHTGKRVFIPRIPFLPNGNRLQATIFGKDIDLRNDMLHIFRSYYISNAYVKPLDPKHRIEAHEYQWILNSRTIIENIPDDEVELQPPEYDIIPFTNLHDYKNTGTEIA